MIALTFLTPAAHCAHGIVFSGRTHGTPETGCPLNTGAQPAAYYVPTGEQPAAHYSSRTVTGETGCLL